MVNNDKMKVGKIPKGSPEIIWNIALMNSVKTSEKGVKTVESDEIFWHMVNAIKELSAKNDALEARLATLEGS